MVISLYRAQSAWSTQPECPAYTPAVRVVMSNGLGTTTIPSHHRFAVILDHRMTDCNI